MSIYYDLLSDLHVCFRLLRCGLVRRFALCVSCQQERVLLHRRHSVPRKYIMLLVLIMMFVFKRESNALHFS